MCTRLTYHFPRIEIENTFNSSILDKMRHKIQNITLFVGQGLEQTFWKI